MARSKEDRDRVGREIEETRQICVSLVKHLEHRAQKVSAMKKIIDIDSYISISEKWLAEKFVEPAPYQVYTCECECGGIIERNGNKTQCSVCHKNFSD